MLRPPLFAVATVCLFLASTPGRALGQGQFVPIVTNDTPLSLPDQFGQQSTVARNQAGDVAVLDTAGSGVHLKMNGSPSWTRVVQAGDEVPGLPGSRIHAIAALQINASGLLAMGVELNLSSGEPQSAIVIYNGASLVNVVDGTQTAPNSGGARFGPGLTLRRLNDAGSLVVTIPAPVPQPNSNQIVIFLVPNGGAPVRIVGVGDAAPGTGGTFVGLEVRGFNSNGAVLIQWGAGGLFIGTTTDFRKVVVSGDPNPLGGTFTTVFNGMLNNLGQVMFTGNNGSGNDAGLFLVQPNLTVTRIVAPGIAAPVPGGGTLELPFGIAYNDAGHVLFDALVISNPSTNRGIFRLAGGVVQPVAYERQPAPGTGSTIGLISQVSMNASGAVAFAANLPVPVPIAYYSQAGTGPLVPLLVDGGPSTVPGGGAAGLPRSVLGPIFDDGRALIHLSVLGGTTDYAYLLRSPTGVTSMILTTSDDLPAGGRTVLTQRGAGVRGAGNVVGFIAMRPGGGAAAFVHDVVSHVTTRVAGDGDPVQGTGERFRIAMPTTLFVNSVGQVALAGFFHDASSVRDGIALASANGGVQKIAKTLDMAGPVFIGPAFGPALAPSGLNSSGQVVFLGITNLNNSQQSGAWVGVAGAPPTSAIKVGDITTDGAVVGGVSAAFAINEAGQVLAGAGIGPVHSLLLAPPGGPIRKVVAVDDASPGGGTFHTGFSSASLNNAGQVAFEANTTFIGGGVFVGSASAPPVAVALNGAAAPGGGVFAFNFSGRNVVINDEGDVLFRASLFGTDANSGRFLRRAPADVVQNLVRQGDPAPGTGFAFSTMGNDSATGASQQLSAFGGVTFRGDYFDGSGTITRYWYVGVDGAVEPVALNVPAAFGGGAVVRTSPTSSWAGSQYPLWARVTGGSIVEGVFLFVPPAAPGPNLIQNADFSGDLASWLTFATPDSSYIQAAVNGGVLEFFRVPPAPGTSNQAVIFQRTGMALDSGTPLIAVFELGNSSSVRKRISVLIQDADFSDLFVCTFWLPPNLALSTYEIRTHTTKAWSNATIAFYAATPGSDGGAYRIDNVSLRAFAEGANDRTECVDPTRPDPPGGPDSPTLLVNGDFAAGLPPWGLFGEITTQVVSDVLWFRRASVTPPAGVVLQSTGQTATAGEIFTATFELGSTYAVRRRVTVLIHDNDFTDLAACTFWLEPGQALQQYQMRMFATKDWTNATVSIYPVTPDASAWLQIDNVTFSRTPGATFSGTDCVEPASPSPGYRHSSGLITNDSATAAITKNANTAMAVFKAMRRGF